MHEPITWEVSYGEGRVIVTSMGHFWRGQTDWDALYCAGFQTIFARSVEYTATGNVTLDVPKEFPGSDKTSIAPPHQIAWTAGGKPTNPAVAHDTSWKAIKEKNVAARLTVGQSIGAFELADGYVIECVASEPMVQEPVLAVWDGNGAMYVAEMRSYMQDERGTGTKTLRNGRVKRLTDTNGDGVMDKATIFIDGLNLPRMILPLDDRLAVVETDSEDVYHYRDTDNDGVADEKMKVFDGREQPAGKSVEHQDSGLIWNLDNYIYISYGRHRYRFTDGEWKADPLVGYWSQWGLGRNDTGRVFYSSNSNPAQSIQMPRQYWKLIKQRSGEGPPSNTPLTLGRPYDLDFLKAKNLCPINDRGGDAAPVKQFTSVCGQSVYRGHAGPLSMYGNYFVCDPTIHVVRRAIIENRSGKLHLTNPYGADEFLLSPDVNFRPVNTHTGPDGCLYVVDMYRGIIQDAPWLSAGPRTFIRESGLSKNIQHGRIWRIRHKDHHPGVMPNMLNETTAELLRHLEHPNGWWRDTAQKMIILRKDRDTVVPALEAMARYLDDPLGRLHALWTLEGIGDGKVNRDVLRHAYRDRDPRVRAAAVQITEPYIAAGADGVFDDIAPLLTDRDGEVARQAIQSLGTSMDERVPAMVDQVIAKHLTHEGVRIAALTVLWKNDTPMIKAIRDGSAFKKIGDAAQRAVVAQKWYNDLAQWERGLKLPKDMPDEQKKWIKSGEAQYFNHCVSCHGQDGKGVSVPGVPLALAPPLAGSPRAKGDPDTLIRILTHGLVGPLEGKVYGAGMMVPAKSLGITRSDRLAETLTYIRYSWGNDASPIAKQQVDNIRRKSKRQAPWTLDELNKATESQ